MDHNNVFAVYDLENSLIDVCWYDRTCETCFTSTVSKNNVPECCCIEWENLPTTTSWVPGTLWRLIRDVGVHSINRSWNTFWASVLSAQHGPCSLYDDVIDCSTKLIAKTSTIAKGVGLMRWSWSHYSPSTLLTAFRIAQIQKNALPSKWFACERNCQNTVAYNKFCLCIDFR